jgi:hypothetical protein
MSERERKRRPHRLYVVTDLGHAHWLPLEPPASAEQIKKRADFYAAMTERDVHVSRRLRAGRLSQRLRGGGRA